MVDYNEKISELKSYINQNLTDLYAMQDEIVDYNQLYLSNIKIKINEQRKQYREYNKNSDSKLDTCRQTLIELINSILQCLEFHLSSVSKTNESKIVLCKTKGDYIRYLIELNEHDEGLKSKHIQEALVVYTDGIAFAESFEYSNVNKLGLILNFSVLLADEMYDVDRSMEIIKETLAKSDEFFKNNQNHPNYENCKIITGILSDNYEYYKENHDLYINRVKIE